MRKMLDRQAALVITRKFLDDKEGLIVEDGRSLGCDFAVLDPKRYRAAVLVNPPEPPTQADCDRFAEAWASAYPGVGEQLPFALDVARTLEHPQDDRAAILRIWHGLFSYGGEKAEADVPAI